MAVEALDFRVEISGGATRGYEVVLRTPDGGEVSAAMQLPVTADELEALAARVPDAVIASSATARRGVSRSGPVRELGGLLFDSVLAGQGRGMLAAVRHQANREGRQLRIVLQVRPPELARLPWEFLFDSREDDYVCLSTVLVRYPQVHAPVRPLQVTAPLRILGMAARPGDEQALAIAAERDRLDEALGGLQRAGRIELGWVPGQTWRDLRTAMRHDSWNVLHFIGHGGFDTAAQEGTLALADDSGGGTYRLGADSLAMLLRGHPALRLVVLNAMDVFSSVAGALIRRGMPAVLAMQHEITDQAALEFSRTFYEELAYQPSVDRCVMQARQAIRLALPGSLEWGTPVLYMRSANGVLFDLADTPDSSRAKQSGPAPAGLAGQVDSTREPDDLYTEALAALHTERWDEAIQAFRVLVSDGRGYKDSERKLEQARRGQQLAAMLSAGRGAAAAGHWKEAIKHLEAIVAAEPEYQDAQQLLTRARHEQAIAELRAEGRIFVSYRRDDSAYPSGWLFDKLAQHFGPEQVFKDIDSIQLGDDFVEVVTAAVERCDVLLALIGRRWLTITDEDGRRRLDNPSDFVRLEIEAAITRNVRIIPILVDGARMPRADDLPPSLARLARRQALELSPANFTRDVSRLLKVLERTLTADGQF